MALVYFRLFTILQDILAGLEAKGHVIDRSGSIAVVQSIRNACAGDGNDVSCIQAACDGRKDGIPDGY